MEMYAKEGMLGQKLFVCKSDALSNCSVKQIYAISFIRQKVFGSMNINEMIGREVCVGGCVYLWESDSAIM